MTEELTSPARVLVHAVEAPASATAAPIGRPRIWLRARPGRVDGS
jgi:hypothetical protein